MAQQIGVSFQAISKWERGESIPDVTVLKAIADLFDVTLDYLLVDSAGLTTYFDEEVFLDLRELFTQEELEQKLEQIRDVSKSVPCEIFAYGRMPLMVTENCLIRGKTGQCTCHLAPAKLTDKTGAEFPIIRDGNTCRSVLLNGKKLSWLDRQEDLAKLGIWAARLYFTTENSREVNKVLSDYMNMEPFDPGACTRGLYLRGVD